MPTTEEDWGVARTHHQIVTKVLNLVIDQDPDNAGIYRNFLLRLSEADAEIVNVVAHASALIAKNAGIKP